MAGGGFRGNAVAHDAPARQDCGESWRAVRLAFRGFRLFRRGVWRLRAMLGFGAGLGFDARTGVCVLVLVSGLVLRLRTALWLGVALGLDPMLRRGIFRRPGVHLRARARRRRPVLVAWVRRGRLNSRTRSRAFVWLT